MAPNSVLLSHTAPLIMSSFTKTTPTNDKYRWIRRYTVGKFQRIFVGTSDKTIRIPVVLPMRETPYCKALVAQHCFRKIRYLVTNNMSSYGYLISTVASYFDFETGTAEAGSESATLLAHREIFLVNNLEGFGFTDIMNKIVIVNSSKPAPRVTYFMVRSIVNGFAVDNRAPDNSLFLEFELRFP